MDLFLLGFSWLAFTARSLHRQSLSGAFIFLRRDSGTGAKFAAQNRALGSRSIPSASSPHALYIGAYVLGSFGVSLPVAAVAGGMIVAAAGWRMLTPPDVTDTPQRNARAQVHRFAPSRLRFYPLPCR